ncbi:MAG: hypothetical protein U0354_02435 [Candidatus Sericytochromatia bacterium]
MKLDVFFSGNIIVAFIWVVIYVLQARILVEMIVSLANTRIDTSNPLYVFNGVNSIFCKPFKRILPSNEGGGMACIFAIVTLITCQTLIGEIFKQLSKLIS